MRSCRTRFEYSLPFDRHRCRGHFETAADLQHYGRSSIVREDSLRALDRWIAGSLDR